MVPVVVLLTRRRRSTNATGGRTGSDATSSDRFEIDTESSRVILGLGVEGALALVEGSVHRSAAGVEVVAAVVVVVVVMMLLLSITETVVWSPAIGSTLDDAGTLVVVVRLSPGGRSAMITELAFSPTIVGSRVVGGGGGGIVVVELFSHRSIVLLLMVAVTASVFSCVSTGSDEFSTHPLPKLLLMVVSVTDGGVADEFSVSPVELVLVIRATPAFSGVAGSRVERWGGGVLVELFSDRSILLLLLVVVVTASAFSCVTTGSDEFSTHPRSKLL